MSLGLWSAEPETLGTVSTRMHPEPGTVDAGKSTELAADALGDLGLDLLGLYKDLTSLRMHTHGPGIAGLHLLQALLVLLGKAYIPHELGGPSH